MRKNKNRHFDDPSQVIFSLFRSAKKPLTAREVLAALRWPKNKRETAADILEKLVRQGKLIRRGKAYGLLEKMPLVAGTLQIQRSGAAFVLSEDSRRRDIFVSPSDLDQAWHGDKVMVAILSQSSGRNPQGRIVRILERTKTELPVRITKKLSDGAYLSQPTDERLRFQVMLKKALGEHPIKVGQIALVAPEKPLEQGVWEGRLLEIFGQEKNIRVQERMVKSNHGIPTEFLQETLAEAALLPDKPSTPDFQGREDLRSLPLVTIDGVTARDFDDAICVQTDKQGFRLWVAVADVAHYVMPGSFLDREALARGNSYYFPLSVEPMFPEKLSNGLCSLVPGQPRLAMVVEMVITQRGKIKNSRFYPAVIQSHARLTYDQIKLGVLDKDPEAQSDFGDLLPMLQNAESLARLMNKTRLDRGSLDFALPEPEIIMDLEEKPADIRPRMRHFGHQLIEEFMIAANEAVASFLRDREIPLLYRIHPEPDAEKLEALFEILKTTDLAPRLPKEVDIQGLQHLLHQAKGSDMEFLANRLTLRSMMQAKYSPINDGHFGLASECYCHFTSPIRRYADLVVHRSLKAALLGHGFPQGSIKKMIKLGDGLNILERLSLEAEREILKRITVLFLEDKVGQSFEGVISSLSDFGFWVELKGLMAEGLVQLSNLTNDYYQFNPKRQELLGQRTGQRYRLGQEVRVRIETVNLSRLEVDLSLT